MRRQFLQVLFLGLAPVLAAAPSPLVAGLQQVAEGFTSPTILVPLEDGFNRLLIGDQVGTVHILGADGKLIEGLFLDLRGRLSKLNEGFDERGLLGLALHPEFATNRKLYVYYSAPRRAGAPSDWDHTSHISEFKMAPGNPPRVDLESERVLLQIDQPYFNHNGGRLVFGPDRYLYIGTGDGGNANDTGRGHSPQGNGQDTSTLLGKILRIDVDKGNPYAIPADNPFASGKGRPEIFAYGLRNPWGISFDREGAREFFVVDVGQTMYEEVNIVVKGGNYGWNLREGAHCFDPNNPKQPPESCPKTGADGQPLRDPILEYKNINGFPRDPEARGISVTGGYVYRGKAIPQLAGRYVFADWSRNWALPLGVLFTATRPAAGTSGSWSLEPLTLSTHPRGPLGAYVVAMGQDAAGELYVLTNGSNRLSGKTGKVFKLIPL